VLHPILLLACQSNAPAPALDAAFAKNVASFLSQHCVECHSGAKPKGELALDAFLDEAAAAQHRDVFEKLLERVEKGEMPPKKRARPAKAEIEALAAWIDARFGRDARPSGDPGRPTLRRLNRAEYTNTIRDLLGVDFDAHESFPSDDVGYGFDNIGDVLSMPDILLEKMLAAAEKITARAILVEDSAHPPAHRVDGATLSESKSSAARGKARVIFTNGDSGFDHRFPRDGEYTIRARVYGDQAGPEAVRIALMVAKGEVLRCDVKAVVAEPQVVEARVRVAAGKQRVAIAFLNDYYKEDDPDPKNRDRNLVVVWLEVVGPLDPPPLSAFQRRELDPKTRGSQRDVIAKLARRAWRRPPASGEVDRLLALATKEKGFEEGVRVALQAILVSPHFLFLVETDAAAGNAASAPPESQRPHEISDHELAARLSYFLWSSMPDDELFALAGEGRLHETATLREQVRRMLRDGRSSALAQNFAGQWLQLRNLDRVSPNPDQFPDFDDALKTAMRAESEMYFDAVLREDRSVLELLQSDFTFVNERLARHYGMPGVRGEEMRRVHVEPHTLGERGGVLTQAAVLTVTSNPTRTSPVKRGKFILENILAAPTPPPPPGVGVLDERHEALKAASLRERLEQHRKDPNCAVCHERLDPLGFGLENFDAVGAWRERDGEHTIDASGELPDGRKFQGPAQLAAILAQDGAFQRCLAKKLATYALGRGLTKRDEPAIDGLVRSLSPKAALAEWIEGIVTMDAFRMRGAEQESGG
jgi:hypothetical protein